MIKENITHTSPTSQVKKLNLLREILSPAKIRVLRALLFYFKKFPTNCYPSHKKLAKTSGTSIPTVKRAINDLIELEVIDKEYKHMDSNNYYFMPEFRVPEMQEALRLFLKNCANLALAGLLSIQAANQHELQGVTLENFYIKNLESQCLLTRVMRDVRAREISKKRARCKQMYQDTLNVVMEFSKKFPLTEHGIIKLSAFPVAAVKFALNTPLSAKLSDPFAFIVERCQRYCRENRIAVDWAKYLTMRDTLGIDPNSTVYYDVEAFKDMYQEETAVYKKVPKAPQREYRKGDPVEEPYVRPTTGPRSEWKPTEVRDEKFNFTGKMKFLDGDPLAQKTREENPAYDEYAAILMGGFSEEATEALATMKDR